VVLVAIEFRRTVAEDSTGGPQHGIGMATLLGGGLGEGTCSPTGPASRRPRSAS